MAWEDKQPVRRTLALLVHYSRPTAQIRGVEALIFSGPVYRKPHGAMMRVFLARN